MRTLLIQVLVAALGLPLAAVAQDLGGEGEATAVSGVTVEAALPCGPADSWRSNAVFDAPPDGAKTTRTGESPGTKAWAEKILEAFARPTLTDPPPLGPGGSRYSNVCSRSSIRARSALAPSNPSNSCV